MGGQRLRGINQQCDQADHSEIRGSGAGGDKHTCGKSPQRGDEDGRGMVAAGKRSEKNGQRAQDAGREHALGALGVGIVPVGISYVERATGHHHAASRHVQRDSGGQR